MTNVFGYERRLKNPNLHGMGKIMKKMPRSAFFLLLLWLFSTSLSAQNDPRWYKGNTHAHTVLCGHADTEPAAVVRWYHDRGYHFLILSEHNQFIDPDTVTMPVRPREDFILIPGEEVTGALDIHTTAMNIGGYVDPGPSGPDKTTVIQAHVDSTRARAGIPILNHPNFVSGAYAAEILPVRRLHLFELYNGHPLVYNWGEREVYHHVSTEAKWDSLLSAGMRIYGVSSDDAHIFQAWSPERSNPGRGWVMVRSAALTPDAITEAMARGDFYASNGVILRTLEATPDRYRIEVDRAATQRELQSPYLLGRRVETGPPGYRIEFYGQAGKLLKTAPESSATYEPRPADGYVRARVVLTLSREEGLMEYYAWTQPVFFE